jgi:hypothetical protein
VVPAGNITDHSEVKQFGEHMDVQGPEDFFLKLSLNESLIPETWQRIRSFYFGEKEIPDPNDLIKVRQAYVTEVSNSTQTMGPELEKVCVMGCFINVIRMVTPKKVRSIGHVARMGLIKNKYPAFIRKFEGKRARANMRGKIK